MSFEVEQLNIVIYSNINNKSLESIIFKQSMLYNPEIKGQTAILNDYPYFTQDLRYPEYKIRSLMPPDRIDFFFNKTRFIEFLKINTTSDEIINQADKGYLEKRRKNIKNNIMLTLEILFPTKFPVISDLHSSLDRVLKKESFFKMVINPFSRKYFSYLKPAGDTTYTFKKVVWLNDVFNHPEYRKLIDECNTFVSWSKDEKMKNFERLKSMAATMLEQSYAILDDLVAMYNNAINEYYKITPKPTKYIYVNVDADNFKNLIDFILLLELSMQTPIEKSKILDKINTIDELIIIKSGSAETPTPIAKYINDTAIPDIKMLNAQLLNDVDIYNKIQELITKDSGNWVRGNVKMYINDNAAVGTPKDVSILPSNITLASKIKTNIDKIKLNDLTDHITAYNEIDNLFTETKPAGFEKYAEYRNFASILMTKYRSPFRESTNEDLQTIINYKDQLNVLKFYEIFRNLYKFINKDKLDIDQKELNKYIDIGLSYINLTSAKDQKPRREVSIMADFIEGQIDDANVNSIYCPYMGEYLGNSFDYMMKNYLKSSKSIEEWSVFKNRMMFSLKTMKIDPTGKKQEVVGVPMKSTTSEKQYNENKNADQEKQLTNNLFMSKIFNKSAVDFKILFTNMNSTLIKPQPINEFNMLDNIRENDNTLYKAMADWSKNEFVRNTKLLDDMLRIQSSYNGTLSQLKQQRDDLVRFNKQNTPDYNTNTYEMEKNKLYLKVIDSLIDNEKAKMITAITTGGMKNRLQLITNYEINKTNIKTKSKKNNNKSKTKKRRIMYRR